jgi:hypothetical protein
VQKAYSVGRRLCAGARGAGAACRRRWPRTPPGRRPHVVIHLLGGSGLLPRAHWLPVAASMLRSSTPHGREAQTRRAEVLALETRRAEVLALALCSTSVRQSHSSPVPLCGLGEREIGRPNHRVLQPGRQPGGEARRWR